LGLLVKLEVNCEIAIQSMKKFMPSELAIPDLTTPRKFENADHKIEGLQLSLLQKQLSSPTGTLLTTTVAKSQELLLKGILPQQEIQVLQSQLKKKTLKSLLTEVLFKRREDEQS